jgi:hypothetical protein
MIAFFVPKWNLQQPKPVATQYRAVSFLRLAKSQNPGECQWDPDGFHAEIVSFQVFVNSEEADRRLDVILRADMVEKAKAGDKCTFTGTFIVVPDVSQLGLPGVNKEMMRENNTGRGDGGVASQGVTGLKALGVRDLQYKTAFLACHVRSADSKVRPLLFFGI